MFKITEDRIETENKTIRFPLPLINKIEDSIEGKNVSFSRFVIQACYYALENMEKDEIAGKNKKKKKDYL